MRTKLISFAIALLTGMSAWADDVQNYNVYDDCNKNGQTTDIRPSGQENGYEWVNLGLPSGIKWASCNVGAEKPEDYGNYYAWGEVTTKDDYSWKTYKYANGDYYDYKLTKYCDDASSGDNGFTDNKTTLDLEDDAAYKNWGGNWRMPTYTEFDELIDNCTWTWTTKNGVNGYKVTSNANGNSIFLPAAGCRKDTSTNYVGSSGYYWSSSLVQDYPVDVLYLHINSSNPHGGTFWRIDGYSIRPVCPSYSTASTSNSYVTLMLYANGCESANVIKCNAGQQINVTAVPDGEHRHFVRWTDGKTDNPRLVTVTKDEVLKAEFADDPILSVVSADESMGTVSGAGQFKPNSSYKISAKSNVGYHFTKWSDGNTNNPRTIVLTKDTTFTAEFAQSYSGQCGDNLYWKYYNHTLTISGTGGMYDYNESNLPWLLLRDTTTAVVMKHGITHIGNYAFSGLTKLNKIELPNTLTSIGASAFAGCRKLYEIYSYAAEPPVADNTSFANYNVYLYVPCDNLRDYQMDAVFGSFKYYIQCIEAENTTTDGQVSVAATHNEAVFGWPADGSAATYTLQITKDGEVFCTLVFNANGQLTGIVFSVPARNGVQRNQPAAVLTQTGYRFTVTGLDSNTHYAFAITVKDGRENTLQSYDGSFTTMNEGVSDGINDTNADSPNGDDSADSTVRKILRNGQVLILRNGKTYTLTGVEVK